MNKITKSFGLNRVNTVLFRTIVMGVNPEGDGGGGRVPPSFWSGGGDEYLIIPPLFDMFNEILFLGYLKI
jgi:hypothetical protein